MNYEQYVSDVLRTESQIDNFNVNPDFLAGTLQIYIAIGNMLDQIKKNAYYDKPYDTSKLIQEFTNIVHSMDQVKSGIKEIDNKSTIDVDTRTTHSIIGIATESVELIEALSTHIVGNKLDNINILEEIGDLQWYVGIAMDSLDGNMQNILDTNIAKLKKRYPNKFTSEDSINRDLTEERELLEDNLNINT
jgi:NTP pyrophosphatase (non-canonical NTP hydrolase)